MHEAKNKLIVVVGATGKQGLSVIHSLLKKDYKVRALVRNPIKFEKLIKHKNVETFKGDLKNAGSLKNLFQGAYGLFFALPFTKHAVAYGKTILNLTKESQLQHIVFSSVGGAERNSRVDHFLDKKEIENLLKSINKPYTIIRPVGYMETFAHPKSIRTITGLLKLYISESKKFQLIAIENIGAFTSIVLDSPGKYIGEEIEIAGDELTLDELFEKIKKVKNIQLSPKRFPNFIKFFIPKSLKQMLVFYAEDGWQADLEGLRGQHKGLISFEDWLTKSELY